MKELISAYLVEPGNVMRVIYVEADMAAMGRVISASCPVILRPAPDVMLLIDGDPNKPMNRVIVGSDGKILRILCGDFLVASISHGKPASINNRAKEFANRFYFPDVFHKNQFGGLLIQHQELIEGLSQDHNKEDNT